MNEGGFLKNKEINFFKNIDSRLRKLYDFSVSLYDLSSQLISNYDSNIAMKTNDVVTKLTALTVIFGSLTTITGIYGMNFKHMPELAWEYGYPLALLSMAIVSGVTYWIMKKKKWF